MVKRKGRSKRRKDRRHSGIDEHKRIGSSLIPPLAELPFQQLEWDRDLLPEYLWIAALADRYSLETAHQPYADLLDQIDKQWPHEEPPLGLISDFGEFPKNKRGAFVRWNGDLIRAAFLEPIGRLLALYPHNPASWLVAPRFLGEGGPLDPEKELPRLRKLVIDLYPGKDEHAGHLRFLTADRLAKHGRVRLPANLPVVPLLKKYPHGCSADERWLVQSVARSFANLAYQQAAWHSGHAWPKQFWRKNYDLAACVPAQVRLKGTRPAEEGELEPLSLALAKNSGIIREYVSRLAQKTRYDLYDPERDEVLAGLFSRAARLYVLLAEDPNLWARDVGAILVRCLADTAINFGYLARKGKEEDFRRFKEYAEGQEKLLMLHLQDTYRGEKSLEGRDADDMADSMGPLVPELLTVELGHWLKRTTRALARSAGLEELYRIVYSPSSADIHGTWLSLKRSNLLPCSEPLHRLHLLPQIIDPPVFAIIFITAQRALQVCIQIGSETLGYPPLHEALEQIPLGDEGGPATSREATEPRI